jgi:hypothetical protein
MKVFVGKVIGMSEKYVLLIDNKGGYKKVGL